MSQKAALSSPASAARKKRRTRARSSLFATGEPMIWLTGGALVICIAMVVGLLALVLWKGAGTFWPQSIVKVTTLDGRVYMGEVTRHDSFKPAEDVLRDLPKEVAEQADSRLAASEGVTGRRLFRTGNYRLTQNHFRWVSDFEIAQEEKPPWVLIMERLEWGRFYGVPEAFLYLTPLEEPWSENSDQQIRALIVQLQESSPHEVQLLDRRWVDGREQETLVPVDELEETVQLLTIVEVVRGTEATWAEYEKNHRAVRKRWHERRSLEEFDTGEVNHRQEGARLEVRKAEIRLASVEEQAGKDSKSWREAQGVYEQAQQEFTEVRAWADQEFSRIRHEIDALNQENARYQLLMRTAGEGTLAPQTTLQRLDDVVRAYPANRLGFGTKLGVYFSRWGEFLTEEPREANSEGGVFPAIFGTVAMTLIMSILVVPFGVLAALYLSEYAKAGPLVSGVRIAVNNLAGVPSIVFGVFGLGFFCYIVGASIDELLFSAHLPNPTYGKGGLLWASLTLALLTLPVVIVATEEAVSAVPSSMREGSYACGASKWQTIQRIVLPRALPGIITGMVLAIARGAGEVAPLMLVGAVKLAPELPVDGLFPYLHPERSFMHLGFHIFDVGFQSQNSEAAKPMVFTTTLLLIAIIAVLNLAAITLRNRLRKRFSGGQF